ncbi:MAG TPA: sugar MFS transporter [Cytophagaceae bacterium]
METKSNTYYGSVLAILAALFFMWGLITVLNFMLLDELTKVFNMSVFEANLINLTFFGAYLLVALPAGKLINMIGYKKGIITGIMIAGIGCLLFYPAAENQSYQFCLISLFTLASGITVLQVAANPYVALLGQRGRGAFKLTLVQAFNALGAALAPFFAGGLLLNLAGISKESFAFMSPEEIKLALVEFVQLPYLILAGLLFLLALFLAFSRLPVLNTNAFDPLVKESDPPRKYVIQFPHLTLGAIAIFMYVGAEVSIAHYLTFQASELVGYYWLLSMAGRFIGAFMLTKISPRKSIGVASLIASSLVLAFIFLHKDLALIALVLVGLFNSILFPCIFTMGIDGLGKYSEEGSSVLNMAIFGGAVLPFVIARIDNVILAFLIIFICYLFIAYFGFKGSRYEKKANYL